MSYLAIDPDETGIEKIFDHLLAEKIRENFDQHQEEIQLLRNQAIPGGGFHIYPTGVLGTNGIFPGTGDGQDWNLYNVKIQAWQSLVISDHTDTPRILFRTREGSIEAKGHLYCDEGMQAGSFNLTDAGAGLNGIFQGTGDDSTWLLYSMKIKSHNGLAFIDHLDNPQILFQVREGNILTRGSVKSEYGFWCSSIKTSGFGIGINTPTKGNSSLINYRDNPDNPGITLGTKRSDGIALDIVNNAGSSVDGHPNGTGNSIFRVNGDGKASVGVLGGEQGKFSVQSNDSSIALLLENNTNTNNEFIRLRGYNNQRWTIKGGHGSSGRFELWEDQNVRFSIDSNSGNTYAPGNLAIGPGAGFGERVNFDGDLAFGLNQNIKFTNVQGNRAIVLGQPDDGTTILRPASQDSGGTLQIQKNDGGLIAGFTNAGLVGIGNITPDSILDVSGVISLKKETNTPAGSPTKAKIFSSDVESSSSSSKTVMHFVEEDGTVGRIMHGPIVACTFKSYSFGYVGYFMSFVAESIIVDSHNCVQENGVGGYFQFYARVSGWYLVIFTVRGLNPNFSSGTITMGFNVVLGTPIFTNEKLDCNTQSMDDDPDLDHGIDQFEHTFTSLIYFNYHDKIEAGVHRRTATGPSVFDGNIQIARIY